MISLIEFLLYRQHDEVLQALDEVLQALDEVLQALDEVLQALDEVLQALDEVLQALHWATLLGGASLYPSVESGTVMEHCCRLHVGLTHVTHS